ncbi:phage tail tape measure protein [Bradyrhizobium sp. USDA 313]|uniref:phage tail tape measure protein n=1 Tax=Bradyrhizobium sp. USDA 313 TaxID=3156307 RepID=UPI00351347CB
MSNPSVTATISANDLASPKLRELIATLKQAERVAKEAFSGDGMGKHAGGINTATAAAQKHLGVLHQIHSAHKAIAATVAGYASLRVAHAGVDAIKHAIPYLREDQSIKARTGYSEAEMKELRKQQNALATRTGNSVESTQKTHEIFGRLKYDARTNLAITDPTAVGAKAMGVTAEHNAELMEAMISQYGVHFDSPADAQRKVKHLNDLAAVATKKSNMSFEDVLDYTRYSAAAAHTVNVSPEQNLAMGMALRRSGIVGSEGGVFARQFFARMMAPTAKGREAAAQAGINLDEYSSHGTISGEGLSASLARKFGKSLSKQAIDTFNRTIEEQGDELLSDRGKFAEAVVKARTSDGEKLSETDRKHLTKTANDYFDLTKGGIRGGELLDAMLNANNPMLLQAFLGDKQGARANALLGARDQYNEAKNDQLHADGYSQRVFEEMSQGLAAATDRLSASFDALQNTLVKASEGWITPLVNGATAVANAFNTLSPSMQSFATQFAAATTAVAALTAGGMFVKAFATLTTSAVEASAALQRLAGSAAIAGGANAAGGAAGAASKLGKIASVGTAATLLGAGVLETILFLQSIPPSSTNSNPRVGGGRKVIPGMVNTDIPWEYDSDNPNPRTGGGRRVLRPDAILRPDIGRLPSADTGIQSQGWQDSIIAGSTRPSQGGDGKVSTSTEVHGTVSGEAEMHQNITVTVEPSAYLQAVVARAEAASRVQLNGQLGTSMQGPGDNSVKSTQGPPTGSQE